MRPTTKDLAKHAGVSRATVDRVLNGRPGVRRQTIEAVNAAIKELGFERNLSAANLAKSRVYRFDFLLPRHDGEFLAEIRDQITVLSKAMQSENMQIRCRSVLSRDPHKVVETLSRYTRDTIDGVAIMASESPQVRDATFRLSERDVKIVQFISGQPGERPYDFVGIDNQAAGATAARLLGGFCKAGAGKVLVLTETMNSLDSAERRLGFDNVLQSRSPHLSALPTLETHSDPERTLNIIENTYKNFDDIVGVYVMSTEASLPLEAIHRFTDPSKQVIVAHERTGKTVSFLQDETVDALIVQNPGHVVRSAVRLLKARCDNRPPLAAQENIRIEILLKENLGSVRAG